MSDTVLRWVAEELLGWTPSSDRLAWLSPDRIYGVDELQSWHGIGLVVAAMERRGHRIHLEMRADRTYMVYFLGGARMNSYNDRRESKDKEPWLAVFAAARKAVEG